MALQWVLRATAVVVGAAYLQSNGLPEWASRSIGRVHIDKSKLVRWADSPALNNGACVVDQTADACEDVVVHFASSTAFVACGDPRGRTYWYPPAGQRDAAGRAAVSSFREKLFKHDIKTGKTVELELRGVDGDFVTHGLDLWASPEDPTKVHLFAVRHARDGDSISIFSHTLGTDVAELVRDVKHANIRTANGVAAVGELYVDPHPLSPLRCPMYSELLTVGSEFYLTNDHYFLNDPWRTIEEKLGPWSWTTDVQYCDASSELITCQKVAGSFVVANGIAVWEDRLFVGDSQNGTVTIFQLRPDKGADIQGQVELGAAADNIKIDPTTGDLVVSIFPTLENLPLYLANVEKLGKDLRVPVAALRLPKSSGYKPELLFYDDGGVLSDMTAMAVDPYNQVLIGAAVLQYGGFAVCKMGHSKTA
ncbi:hypothetical protein VTK73DRAFT_6600 [Phialemonium thermophilum]|uniref:Uncharacterized protein n=1 Tax=Phialemonium thermophilum TaxID=223376 RepID=A0ABR3WJ73_9PEZI